MVTSGALAIIENSIFANNFTPNYGDFGGAIFHVSIPVMFGLIQAHVKLARVFQADFKTPNYRLTLYVHTACSAISAVTLR